MEAMLSGIEQVEADAATNGSLRRFQLCSINMECDIAVGAAGLFNFSIHRQIINVCGPPAVASRPVRPEAPG